jgi:hypothetical protein
MGKPIHVKPGLYSIFFEHLKCLARDCGYNLVVHGSMNRDLDLVAIPWIERPRPELEMIQAFDMYLRGRKRDTDNAYSRSILPGGRNNYVININRGDKKGEWLQFADEEYYLDISVTPCMSMTERAKKPD